VEVETIKSYAQYLQSFLEEGDFTQSETFLRSFVKKVIVNGTKLIFNTVCLYRLITKGRSPWEFCLLRDLVEIGGFEPPTSAMRTQRSPS
jgi:hypothetical protein